MGRQTPELCPDKWALLRFMFILGPRILHVQLLLSILVCTLSIRCTCASSVGTNQQACTDTSNLLASSSLCASSQGRACEGKGITYSQQLQRSRGFQASAAGLTSCSTPTLPAAKCKR